jgi:flagellar biosynthesis protein FlhA
MQKLVKAVSKACDDMSTQGLIPIILAHPNVRLIVRRLLEGTLPNIFVVSYNEISGGAKIKTVGMVE